MIYYVTNQSNNQTIDQSIDRCITQFNARVWSANIRCCHLYQNYTIWLTMSLIKVLVSRIGQICFCLRFLSGILWTFLSKNFRFLGHFLEISSSKSSSSILSYVRITFGIMVWTDYYRKCLRRRRRIPCHPTVRTVYHVVSREPALSPPHPCISSIKQGMAYPLNGVCEWSAEPPQQVSPLGCWHCVGMLRWWRS